MRARGFSSVQAAHTSKLTTVAPPCHSDCCTLKCCWRFASLSTASLPTAPPATALSASFKNCQHWHFMVNISQNHSHSQWIPFDSLPALLLPQSQVLTRRAVTGQRRRRKEVARVSRLRKGRAVWRLALRRRRKRSRPSGKGRGGQTEGEGGRCVGWCLGG